MVATLLASRLLAARAMQTLLQDLRYALRLALRAAGAHPRHHRHAGHRRRRQHRDLLGRQRAAAPPAAGAGGRSRRARVRRRPTERRSTSLSYPNALDLGDARDDARIARHPSTDVRGVGARRGHRNRRRRARERRTTSPRFGVTPALGRAIQPDDDQLDAGRQVVGDQRSVVADAIRRDRRSRSARPCT